MGEVLGDGDGLPLDHALYLSFVDTRHDVGRKGQFDLDELLRLYGA